VRLYSSAMNCHENFQASNGELKLPCSEFGSIFFRNGCNLYPSYLPEDCNEIKHVDIMFSAKFLLSDHIGKPVARNIVELPSGYDLRNVLDSECLAY